VKRHFTDQVVAYNSHRKYGHTTKMPANGYRKIRHREGENLPSLNCMETAMVSIQGFHPARVLTRVQTTSSLQLTHRAHSEAPRNSAHVKITNFNNKALTVPKATVLGIAEEISESIVSKINREGQYNFNVPTESHSCEKNKALFRSC
jgi:hypothetical protein